MEDFQFYVYLNKSKIAANINRIYYSLHFSQYKFCNISSSLDKHCGLAVNFHYDLTIALENVKMINWGWFLGRSSHQRFKNGKELSAGD